VSLTGEGKRLVEAILPEQVANEQHLLSELSNKERTELAGLLETLAISLGAEADPSHARRSTRADSDAPSVAGRGCRSHAGGGRAFQAQSVPTARDLESDEAETVARLYCGLEASPNARDEGPFRGG
jgi:hypothetical protein